MHWNVLTFYDRVAGTRSLGGTRLTPGSWSGGWHPVRDRVAGTRFVIGWLAPVLWAPVLWAPVL